MGYVIINETICLSCYHSNFDGTGRFTKGILNNCKVCNYALNDKEINNLLLSVMPL